MRRRAELPVTKLSHVHDTFPLASIERMVPMREICAEVDFPQGTAATVAEPTAEQIPRPLSWHV
jgi:hypothetical protein